jgi:hypothetical protein
MAQITIYLDEQVLELVNVAVRSANVSKSQWIADAVRARARREWPATARALAGAWPDFPGAAQIRRPGPADVAREKL